MISDLEKLIRLIDSDSYLKSTITARQLTEVSFKNSHYPIHAFTLGSKDPKAPVLFIAGGVHGLERIGAQLAWSLLKTTIERMIWDHSLRHLLEHIRIVVLPLVNPVGYHHYMRSNGHGVDLMRNSPTQAIDSVPFLVGGQRFSNRLPWFQGKENILEIESQVLIDLFLKEASQSASVISVDFHSGFGMKDRLWFPFSYTKKPFDHLAEMNALAHLFEQTHPYHIYQIEPQSKGYLLNGDLWDYLFLEFKKMNPLGIFLPMTLEMGSWTWVRKNPLQLLSKHGAFNPIKEHRVKRTYRRHHLLFDFLLKATFSNEIWSQLDSIQKTKHEHLGLNRWYSK